MSEHGIAPEPEENLPGGYHYFIIAVGARLPTRDKEFLISRYYFSCIVVAQRSTGLE